MKKKLFLLVLCNIVLGLTAGHAQIQNGSFTTDLSGWVRVGSPVQGSANPPGGTYADISSTNDAGVAAPAAVLASSLNVILPNTDIIYTPTDGQAIYQYFTLAQPETLSFEYAYSTFDNFPYDSAGFTLDGQYTELKITPYPQQPTPSGYMIVDNIQLSAGEHQLGFVSYNTNDEFASTHIYVTNIELADVPEPTTWLLIALSSAGLASLALVRQPFVRA